MELKIIYDEKTSKYMRGKTLMYLIITACLAIFIGGFSNDSLTVRIIAGVISGACLYAIFKACMKFKQPQEEKIAGVETYEILSCPKGQSI